MAIKDISSGAVSDTKTAQGYSYFRTDDVDAEWKGDSTAFAVGVRGTKTTTDTDIYIKDGEVWERLEFPGFVANILGRQGVFLRGRNLNIDFAGFDGNAHCTLICHVEPDFQQKEVAEKITEWKPAQNTDWKVVLEYARRTQPNCRIVSIEPFNSSKNGGDGPSRTKPEVPPSNGS